MLDTRPEHIPRGTFFVGCVADIFIGERDVKYDIFIARLGYEVTPWQPAIALLCKDLKAFALLCLITNRFGLVVIINLKLTTCKHTTLEDDGHILLLNTILLIV